MPTKHTPESPLIGALPIIAVVGRPNVGKSALFNRILNRRLAIVHEERGVTRDRLICPTEWEGKPFELADTGGLSEFGRADTPGTIEAETRQQSEAAIAEATAVILVVDGMAGMSPLDEEVARLIHRRHVPAVIAVNKCDRPGQELPAAEFERLGFPVLNVSAIHNLGIQELLDLITQSLPTGGQPGAPEGLKITVVGRPNVGKSSFINRLIRRSRMIVSDIPGTTRDSVDIPFAVGSGPTARHYLLTDTAGMRKLGKVDGAVERYSVFRAQQSIERADVAVLMLDASEGPTSQDKAIISLIQEAHKGCVVIINKWDLMKSCTQKEYLDAMARALPYLKWVPVVFISALDGYNIRQCLEAISEVADMVRTRLPTGVLNRTLLKAYERVQPPVINNKRFKIYYATQLGVQPLRIGLFVNYPKRMLPAYRDYLIGVLRKEFGLAGAPIMLIPMERSRDRFVEKDERRD